MDHILIVLSVDDVAAVEMYLGAAGALKVR